MSIMLVNYHLDSSQIIDEIIRQELIYYLKKYVGSIFVTHHLTNTPFYFI